MYGRRHELHLHARQPHRDAAGEMRLRGKPIQADKSTRSRAGPSGRRRCRASRFGRCWSRTLRDKKVIVPKRLELPRVIGTTGISARLIP